MKVLLVSEFLPPVRGGLEAHVAALGAELVRAGHQVAFATTTREPEPQAGPVWTIPTAARLLPHEDRDRPFQLPVPDPAGVSAFRRVVRGWRPDVVHAHNWLGTAARVAARKVPLVLTLHDYGQVCALRALYDADGRACAGPAARKCLRCAAAMMDPARAAVLVPATAAGRRLMRPDAVVAVSAAVREAVGPWLRTPVEVVPNFFTEPPDDAAAPALPPDFPTGRYVLFGGDVGAHKGLDDLLAAWQLRAADDVTLVVATTRTLDRAVPDGVVVTSLDPAQMPAAWAGAQLAVVPSRWPEPAATVVLEAYRAGTPALVTAVGGLPELVRHGSTGLVVPPSDPAALAAAMDSVLGSAALRERLARGALEASVTYRPAVVAERLVEVYRRAVRR